MRAAFHTLGCKVNQYDSQAMLELFERAGYEAGSFDEPCDVYVINTCTVTGTGDKKSLQAVRRAQRLNPAAQIVVCGCLAQRDGEKLLAETGARLILGTARRQEVVTLLEEAVRADTAICAVTDVRHASFEPLLITRHEGRTRATLKIQEGCDRFCTYCIIPYVRGGIRTRPVADVAAEAARLAAAGYREIVLTGIELTEYGKDLADRPTLNDLIRLSDECGVERLRLGSLDPRFADEAFAQTCAQSRSLCHQFHLSLQAGSDTVLARMNRRYTAAEYLRNADRLRAYMPDAAITTDVIAGFPGETEAEHQETAAFLRQVGFARIHVFPYSRRPGTKAASMPGQLTRQEKARRARELIALGDELEKVFIDRQIGTLQQVLMEEDGTGYTGNYVRVRCPGPAGELVAVRIVGRKDTIAEGESI